VHLSLSHKSAPVTGNGQIKRFFSEGNFNSPQLGFTFFDEKMNAPLGVM
jgi:hypothetical protein